MEKSYRNNKDLKLAIGSKLRKARIEAGYTQTTLAKELGLVHGAIGSYERGRLSISVQLLLELCVLLEKPITYFVVNKTEEQLIKKEKEQKKAKQKRYNLDDNIEFTLEMSIRNYLRSRGFKGDLELITKEILEYIHAYI